ncbi:hypothetical protein QYF61_011013 [Mycteria americana]|uniref:Uncharacterized protein n=1 Tax=Mycteria americana TaxID=33587 RepID=A0AAN7NRZ0_MYCAM|nr:hypothetical protein QYF61_011013 [Mycteria americana]
MVQEANCMSQSGCTVWYNRGRTVAGSLQRLLKMKKKAEIFHIAKHSSDLLLSFNQSSPVSRMHKHTQEHNSCSDKLDMVYNRTCPAPLAPFKYWKAAIRSPPSLLFSRLNNPNSLSLSSQERCSSPRIIFVALLWTCSNSSMSFLC